MKKHRTGAAGRRPVCMICGSGSGLTRAGEICLCGRCLAAFGHALGARLYPDAAHSGDGEGDVCAPADALHSPGERGIINYQK